MVRRQNGLLWVFVAVAAFVLLVRLPSFVAFDTNPAALQQIYEAKILAEAVDGGEALTPAAAAGQPGAPPRGRER